MIDLRCETQATEGGRCQLLAGHEAAHALVHDDPSGSRAVRRWKADELVRDIPVESDASALCLPWAPGMPVTTHVEPAPPAVVPIVTAPSVRPVSFIGRGPHRPVRSA